MRACAIGTRGRLRGISRTCRETSARLGSASLSGVGQEQVGECRVENSLRAADRARPSTHRLICSLGAQRQMDGQSKCAARLPDRMSLDDDAPASDS